MCLITKEARGGVLFWTEVDRVQYGKCAHTYLDDDGVVHADLLRHEHDTGDE